MRMDYFSLGIFKRRKKGIQSKKNLNYKLQRTYKGNFTWYLKNLELEYF